MTPSSHNESRAKILVLDSRRRTRWEEERVAIGKIIPGSKKSGNVSSNEARKKTKDRIARRKRGEDIFPTRICSWVFT